MREQLDTDNNLTNNKQLFSYDNSRIEMYQRQYEPSQPITSQLNWQTTNNIMT